MQLHYFRVLKRKKVYEERSGLYQGKIAEIFFHPKDFASLYLICRKWIFLQYVLPEDLNIAEQVFVRSVIKRKPAAIRAFNPMNMPVYTESGMFVGRVSDYTIDTRVYSLVHLVVMRRGFFMDKKVFLIHREEVISFSKKKIVVKDLFLETAQEMIPSFLEKKNVPVFTSVSSQEYL